MTDTPTPEEPKIDLLSLVGEELDRLPDRYRSAVILCDLDGLSRAVAARRLGWNEGSLSTRLHRGRKKLADALLKRGVALPAGGLIVLLAVEKTPASLLRATLASVPSLLSGSSKTGLSVSALAIHHSITREMTMRLTTRIIATVMMVTSGIFAAGLFQSSGIISDVGAAPVIKPEPAPELPAAAYELLRNRKTLKEMNCTPEQMMKIEDFFEEQDEKSAAIANTYQNYSCVLRVENTEPDIRKVAEKLLTKKQLFRLGQIEIQARGAAAFTDPKLIDSLKLTEAQRESVQAAMKQPAVITLGETVKAAPNQAVITLDSAYGGLRKNDQATVAKVLDNLTNEQLAKWKNATGKPIAFDPHPKRNDINMWSPYPIYYSPDTNGDWAIIDWNSVNQTK